MRLELRCDCAYSVRTRAFLFLNIVERGFYRLDDGEIVFTHAGEETTRWPYRLDGDALVLEEAPGEEHTYERRRRLDCGGGA